MNIGRAQEIGGCATVRTLTVVMLFLFAFTSGIPFSAHAQLRDCQGVSGVRYKVHLDEPSHGGKAFASKKDLRTFMDRLSFMFENERERLKHETETEQLSFLPCYGRKPKGKADFTRRVVDGLYTRNIVLEMWGILSPISGTGGVVGEARVQYVIVPVRFQHFEGSLPLSGAYFAKYVSDTAGAGAYPEWLDLFREAIHLDAYVAAGLGLKAQADAEYELAAGNLCKAKLLLAKVAKNDPGTVDKLLSHLSKAVREVIKAAKADRAYVKAKGPLILTDENDPCPREDQ